MKQSLSPLWTRVDGWSLADMSFIQRSAMMPVPLRDLFDGLPKAAQREAHYWEIPLALDTPLRHAAHILWVAPAKRCAVTWTGKGVREGVVVYVDGPSEATRRKVEAGSISSVPPYKPLKTGLKRSEKRETSRQKHGFNSLPAPVVPLANISRRKGFLLEGPKGS
jgi:hypothetical protein